jgi:glutamate-1-semialdehyde 2,1-aminomutase
MRNDSELFLAYRRRLTQRGIFKIPMNLKRAHISYAHTARDVHETLHAAEDVLSEVSKGLAN